MVAIGVVVLVVSIAIDAPKGLDEGEAAVAYESASATLLSGFWLQIAAGVVLVGCGLLLPAGSCEPASALGRRALRRAQPDRSARRPRPRPPHARRRARPK